MKYSALQCCGLERYPMAIKNNEKETVKIYHIFFFLRIDKYRHIIIATKGIMSHPLKYMLSIFAPGKLVIHDITESIILYRNSINLDNNDGSNPNAEIIIAINPPMITNGNMYDVIAFASKKYEGKL